MIPNPTISMNSKTPTLTFKAQGFYVACAPQAGIVSYGGCFEKQPTA